MNKFRVGDIVVGTCKSGDPYSTTCRGWRGKILNISDDWQEILLKQVGDMSSFKGHWVSYEYFKLDKPKKCFKENIYV